MTKDPYSIIKRRYITEKASVLASLHAAESNKSLKKCKNPKAVFLVDPKANKKEIAWAIEQIFAEKKVKVVSVNTIIRKPKRRRVRGYSGFTKLLKKAIVTFEEGDVIDEQV